MQNNFNYGQHFLIDEDVLSKIIFSSSLNSNDVVLEIGPGKGVLTEKVFADVKKVYAVEIDKRWAGRLRGKFENVEVITENILDVIDDLTFNKIVANISYAIVEPLLKKMFRKSFECAVLLVGNKFYDVLNDKKSKWSYIVPLFYDVDLICGVSPKSFNPPPRVNSVVLKIVNRKEKLNKINEIMKEFVLQDDKKVKNALKNAFIRVFGLTQREALAKVVSLGLPFGVYEKNVDYISNDQFLKLLNRLETIIK